MTRTADQLALPTGGAGTAVAWESEASGGDPDAMHDTATNNSRVAILTPGWYKVDAALWWSAAGGTQRAAFLRKNGVTTIGDDRKPPTPVLAAYTFPEVRLVAGDYLELLAFQDSGGALNLTRDANFPRMSVRKAG